MLVSAPLIEDAKAIAGLAVVGDSRELPFDDRGGFQQELLFPECVRALRGKPESGH